MKTILLAEDDPFITGIYANKFREAGFKVDVAKDGQMALSKIKNNYPDLLILDINLPEIDGRQLLKMIREDKKTKNLKVIVISNFTKSDVNEDIDSFGVIKYFLKIETTPEEVLDTVKGILK